MVAALYYSGDIIDGKRYDKAVLRNTARWTKARCKRILKTDLL